MLTGYWWIDVISLLHTPLKDLGSEFQGSVFD
jgi:hypothetical protein